MKEFVYPGVASMHIIVALDRHPQVSINAVKWGGAPEGALIIGIIGQACQDAMGLYNSECERVYSETQVNEKGSRRWISRKEEARRWFVDKCHYPYADMVGLEPTWITHLLKQAGVKL